MVTQILEADVDRDILENDVEYGAAIRDYDAFVDAYGFSDE